MKSEHELILEKRNQARPPTKAEVATLVEYVNARIGEIQTAPTLVELEEFVECVKVKLPVLTQDRALEIVRLALHKVPMRQIIPEVIIPPPGRPPKLTQEQKIDALQRLGNGGSQDAIARSYRVDRSVISRLRSDKWNLRG